MSGKGFLGTFGGTGRTEQIADATGQSSDVVLSLAVPMVEPDPHQPRKHFDEQKLAELAESLKLQGQLQPILVKRSGVVGRYQIVAGERRWRACKLAGIDRIRAIEVEERATGSFIREAQFVENLHRDDMTPIETAECYREMMRLWGCSQNELARRLGVGAATVSRALALLQAPEDTRERIAGGESVRKATGGGRAPRRKVSEKPDKRRAVELELVSGTVRVKRGYSLEQLVAELRSTLDAERTRSDAA